MVAPLLRVEELLLFEDDTEDDRVCERLGVTWRLPWLVPRWPLTRDDELPEFWLRAGVLDTFRLDDEFRVGEVALVALLLVRGVAVVLRVDGVTAWFCELEPRLFVAARVVARLLSRLLVVARLFVLVVARVGAVACVLVPRLFCVARTALLPDELRALPVAVARVLERVEGVLARLSVAVRLFVTLERLFVFAVRVAAERTLDASVTRLGRAVLRVLWFTSGRYMFTVRSLTDARPGREVFAICLTATRLLVTRCISLCLGPLTYVRLL